MSWDDGKHEKVNKVQITYDDVIHSIQVTYQGSLQSHLRGSVGPKPAEFTLERDEYITALSAYGKRLSSPEVITGLTFTTNKNNTYGPYGNKTSFQFSAQEVTGQQIAGFIGTSGNVLNSIDVHYAPVHPQKLKAEGGETGVVWDDGSDHEAVTKVEVRSGGVIQFVKFDYMKEGQPKEGTRHGGEDTKGSTRPFDIKHPDEYLISVDGWYDSSNVIEGIQFKTNKKTSDYFGHDYEGKGTRFDLQVPDKKIIGFHGSTSTDNRLNSIGAYFVPVSTTTTKLKAEGGETGAVWDDGAHDNVKKIYVGQGHDGIAAVKFEYANGSIAVFGYEHGKKTFLGFEEFKLESDEYITSVEGTYDNIFGPDSAVVTTLMFKTNKNKTFGPLGIEGSSPFTLKEEHYKIVGFHGRAGESINAIGAYLAPVGTIPLVPATPA